MQLGDHTKTIDHSNTLALFIVASSFPNDSTIEPIPNVLANLQHLKASLTNPDIVGIPETNITISIDESRSKIEKKLRDIAEKTKNRKYTLLVYYSGHGILSSEDYQLYLATHETTKKDLEIEAVGIEDFRKYIKKSTAGRKIVILDCCHSGAIMGSMGHMSSKIQSELNGFEGTYIMTSAAEDTPSLFPEDKPQQPTFFTGKLVDVLNEGLDSDKEYSSLRDIYNEINIDFREKGLPVPQQSNFNNADQINFAVNRKFVVKKPPDEVAWEEAVQKNYKWTFIDFKNHFPNSPFVKEAKKKIFEIEEDESWDKASNRNTVGSLYDYLDNYPEGRYFNEANQRIRELRDKDEKKRREAELEEESAWNEALTKDSISSFEGYLSVYPFGRFSQKAKVNIQILQEEEQRRVENQKLIEEESLWEKTNKENSIEAFKSYLSLYPLGKFSHDAESYIDTLTKIHIQKSQEEQKERERDRQWNEAVKENTISSYETFLHNYPVSTLSDKAKATIESIKEKEKQNLEREKTIAEELFWKEIENTDSKAAFNKYLQIYPLGKFNQEAKNQIANLNKKEQEEKERKQRWNKATEQNAISSYEEFLEIYQDGRFTEEAKNNIQILKEIESEKFEKERVEEEQFWEKITKKNTAEAYQEYLSFYPSGRFTSDANNQLIFFTKEQEEEKLWNESTKENEISSYQRYLTTFPTGRFSEEAKDKILSIEKVEKLKFEREREVEEDQFWNRAKNENLFSSFQEYLGRYPQGRFSDEAKSQIEVLNKIEREKVRKKEEEIDRQRLWRKVLGRNNIKSYKQYLTKYPEGTFSDEARSNIRLLEEKQKEQQAGSLNNTSKFKNRWILGSVVLMLSLGLVIFALVSRESLRSKVSPDLELQAQIDIVNGIYDNMVKVQGGTFTMGIDKSEYESPAHFVTVNTFLISKYEVTRKQWNAVMGDGKFNSSWELPATNITWIDTHNFINKLNILSDKKYRLPTESEWEYTAVTGYEEKYKGSENDYSWNINNSKGTLHTVGGKLPDKYGTFDLLGNVYEWCNDAYSKYNTKPIDNDIKIIRGGDYKRGVEFISPKIRNMEKSTKSSEEIGFRLAMDL